MAALVASKMPVGEASAVLERLTGVKLPRASLDREARRQGRKAEGKRQAMDEQMSQGSGAGQLIGDLRLNQDAEPFTLVIELDAWNIRERNEQAWARTEQFARARPRARVVALGLWGDVFSFKSASANQRRPFGNSESGDSDDPRWESMR